MREHDADVAQVVVGGASHDRVAERGKEWTAVEHGKGLFGVEAEGAGSPDGGGIGDGAGGGAVTVQAVGAGAEGDERFVFMPGQVKRACKGELLIAAAAAALGREGDGHFAAREQGRDAGTRGAACGSGQAGRLMPRRTASCRSCYR